MGRQLLFELLQDRAFLLFLSDFSELSGEQVDQTGIDLIYYQIGTVARSAAVLQHGNGFCPGFIVLRDTPVMVLALDGVGKNKLYPFRPEFFQHIFNRSLRIQPVLCIVGADGLFNGFFASTV